MTIKVPDTAEWIIEKLNEHDYEAYVVGGCVRDSLLGRQPEDWDITTSAKPADVKEIFGHTIDTGIRHGTVTVMVNHVGYEVTTYRVDGEYEDGRHPKSVEFTSSLSEDLKRRDFTINAMAYSKHTGLVDIFGGADDLKKGIVRCVGRASERFTEDALRVLRAIRFSAQLDFKIEDETIEAIRELAPNMVHVSKERILVELTKLLLSDHPGRIQLVDELGISPYISKLYGQASEKLKNLMRPSDGMTYSHGISSLPASRHMRWAGFLRACTRDEAEAVCRELKMDNDTTAKVKTLVGMWREEIAADAVSIRRVMSKLTPEMYDDLIHFSKVFASEEYQRQLALVERESDVIREAGDCVNLKDLAVNGNDLIAAGMKPGPELGRTLSEMFELVLEHPEFNEKGFLMERLHGRLIPDYKSE